MHTAYVDESEPGGGLDHTVYVMAAVLVADDRTDELRAAVRMTTPERMRKLHWYEALLSQRLTWIGLLAHAISVVVVRYEGAHAQSGAGGVASIG